MILSGFSPVKANWWITFGMGADTKKKITKNHKVVEFFFVSQFFFWDTVSGGAKLHVCKHLCKRSLAIDYASGSLKSE